MLRVNHLSGFGRIVPAVGGSYDTDAQAFFTATGISDTTIKDAVDALVISLKADGIWANCIAIYPFVGGTADTHKYNLKDPQDTDAAFRVVWSGITHNANGITGGSGQGDTKIVPATHMTLNDTHVSIYSRTDTDSGTDIGVISGSDRISLRVRTSGGCALEMYTSGGTGAFFTANGDGKGFYVGTRRSSSDMESYKNGVSIDTQTGAHSGALPTTNSLYLCNLNGFADASGKNIAFASVGAGLTDTEVADFTTAVETFQDALSRGVV